MSPTDTAQLFDALGVELERLISEELGPLDDVDLVKSTLRDVSRKLIYNETHRRPLIIPVVLEV
jgi:mRNA degradation ribonuclease J1/J2